MYRELEELIEKSKKIALISHVEPDADALGSSLAFYLALKSRKKSVYIVNITKSISNRYDFLPSFKKIKQELPKGLDLVISFDCGSYKRLGIGDGDFKLINIDHHRSNEMFGDINIVHPELASTSSVVYDILEKLSYDIDKDIALCIYTALAEDTNFFSDSSTDWRVFDLAKKLLLNGVRADIVGKNLLRRNSLAKLRLEALFIDKIELKKDAKVAIGYVDKDMLKISGALRYDTAHLADILQSLATVKLSIFRVVIDDELVKFSLRSDEIDVSKIAKRFGGGGHRESAGFSVDATQKEIVIDKILEDLDI